MSCFSKVIYTSLSISGDISYVVKMETTYKRKLQYQCYKIHYSTIYYEGILPELTTRLKFSGFDPLGGFVDEMKITYFQ